ncbi:unnamed protein product [Pedinophyceae sp. YPF-701]|nr:unnamed protein product [Pedinophyceae sp. YPF-701]
MFHTLGAVVSILGLMSNFVHMAAIAKYTKDCRDGNSSDFCGEAWGTEWFLIAAITVAFFISIPAGFMGLTKDVRYKTLLCSLYAFIWPLIVVHVSAIITVGAKHEDELGARAAGVVLESIFMPLAMVCAAMASDAPLFQINGGGDAKPMKAADNAV